MIRRFFLALSLLAPGAMAAPWDGSALVGVGKESFAYEPVPMFPDVTIPRAMHLSPYKVGEEKRLLIAGGLGELWSVPVGAKISELPEPVYRLEDRVGKVGHRRLLSCLFARDYSFLYLFYNSAIEGKNTDQIVRFPIVTLEPLQLGEGQEILSWHSHGHNGGDMAWGPHDGMLYISAGDRSAPGDPSNVGQRVDGIYGSILRITADGKIPEDNPFVGMSGVRPEIWSYGLRNPWRFTFHPERHELWVGDNGDESWEMVHHIRKGANAGWSVFEGSQPFRASNKLGGPTLTHTPPAVQHPHTEMRSVIGGIFYRGDALPKLRDHYLYACYFTKRMWAFSYKDGVIGEPFEFSEAGGDVVSIIEGHDREPIITCRVGSIFRLRALPEAPPSSPWPEKLSKTKLYADTAENSLAVGVHSYAINAESWADGAKRERFFAIPNGEKMMAGGGENAGKSWRVPFGSAVGQTFTLKERRVETQLLYFDGIWRGYTYRWDDDGKDATLVSEAGENADFDGQPWRYHARSECMTCHTQQSNYTLAMSTDQLNRDEQIQKWVDADLLQDSKYLRRESEESQADPYDESLDLHLRARSYLQINCAHCHREAGLGGRAGFQLLEKLPVEGMGVVGAKPFVGLLGKPDAKVIAPGSPDNSELLGRMLLRGAGQMPLIGSHKVDEKGAALIRAWIESMK